MTNVAKKWTPQRWAEHQGRAWEHLVRDELDRAREARLLRLPRHHQPRSAFAPGRGLVYAGASGADFGATLEGGLELALECKSTGDEHFELEDIRPSQREHLDAVSAAGGLALFALEFRAEDRKRWLLFKRHPYLIPWHRVPWMLAKTRHRVTQADVAPWAAIVPGALRAFLRPCGTCCSVVLTAEATPRLRLRCGCEG